MPNIFRHSGCERVSVQRYAVVESDFWPSLRPTLKGPSAQHVLSDFSVSQSSTVPIQKHLRLLGSLAALTLFVTACDYTISCRNSAVNASVFICLQSSPNKINLPLQPADDFRKTFDTRKVHSFNSSYTPCSTRRLAH